MNGKGNMQDELYKRVEDALIYHYRCPFSADFRVKEWRTDLYTDIERVYNTLKPFKDNKNLIDYVLRFYVEHRRRCKLWPNYWSAVREYAKYERLENVLLNVKHNCPENTTRKNPIIKDPIINPIIKICSYSASPIVKQWQLIWYDSPHSRHTHTEKHCISPKLSNPNLERKYPEKPLKELHYIGPYLITEWPGVGNKRKYTDQTPGYNTVIDSLLCAVEGKLDAIRFNTPPIPDNTRSENVNGIVEELRPFYWLLRKNAVFTDDYATTSFVIDLFGLPEELKYRDRFLNRISAPQIN